VAHFVDNNGPERPTYAHQTVPHELRNAWRTTKTLEEQLEIANQPILRRVVMHVRESLFAELMAIEGYSEVPVAPEA
jgi:hypothetical protein